MNTIITLTENLTSLERAVYGTNLINGLTIQNLRKVLPQLETYKSKKICLATGYKAKIFNISLLEFSNKEAGQHLRTFIKFEQFAGIEKIILFQDVTVKDKNYVGGGYGVSYYHNEIDLGYLTNGVLTEITTLYDIEQSYKLGAEFCAKKVKETKDKIEQLKKEVSNLETSIYQFKNIY